MTDLPKKFYSLFFIFLYGLVARGRSAFCSKGRVYLFGHH